MNPVSPKIAALIPARGGSKGIPGKNLRPVGGIPLVVRSIMAASGVPLIDRIFVSTDDPAIAAVSRESGAEIVSRPAELSGDQASSESALLHALDQWRTEGYEPDYLLFLQCTSPLTRAEDLTGLIEHTLSSHADSSFTGVASHRFIWREDGTGGWQGANHDKSVRPRRQDRQREIMENGAAYLFKVAGFRDVRHRFFGKTVCWEVPADQGVEIDEEFDLTLLDALLSERRRRTTQGCLPADISAVVLDFDGVFTDNRVHLSQTGEESVVCSRGDGLAIARFKKEFSGRLLVLSTETNPVVLRRCEKLGIECIHGASPKEAALQAWCDREGIPSSAVVFLGNDLNDLGCLRLVGGPVVVADAHPLAQAAARIVLTRKGGDDAVRELLNLIPTQSPLPF